MKRFIWCLTKLSQIVAFSLFQMYEIALLQLNDVHRCVITGD